MTTNRILIVEDHAAMIEGYKSMLAIEKSGIPFAITTARDCESGYKAIVESEEGFNLIFFDISLPPYPSRLLRSGIDLAVLAKKVMPESKIVIFTSHADIFTLDNIVKSVQPDGLLVKSDIGPVEFLEALHLILDDEKYFSLTARKNLAEAKRDVSYLDSLNRNIIWLLSAGIKTKNLPQHIHLSISAIDKRKAMIKDFFNIVKGTDEDIIREARKKGLI